MLVLKSFDATLLSEIWFWSTEWSQKEYLELLPKQWDRSLSPLQWHKSIPTSLISKKLLEVHTSVHSSECQSSAGMNSVQFRWTWHRKVASFSCCKSECIWWFLVRISPDEGGPCYQSCTRWPCFFQFCSQLQWGCSQLHSSCTYCCLKSECEMSDLLHLAKLIVVNYY